MSAENILEITTKISIIAALIGVLAIILARRNTLFTIVKESSLVVITTNDGISHMWMRMSGFEIEKQKNGYDYWNIIQSRNPPSFFSNHFRWLPFRGIRIIGVPLIHEIKSYPRKRERLIEKKRLDGTTEMALERAEGIEYHIPLHLEGIVMWYPFVETKKGLSVDVTIFVLARPSNAAKILFLLEDWKLLLRMFLESTTRGYVSEQDYSSLLGKNTKSHQSTFETHMVAVLQQLNENGIHVENIFLTSVTPSSERERRITTWIYEAELLAETYKKIGDTITALGETGPIVASIDTWRRAAESGARLNLFGFSEGKRLPILPVIGEEYRQ